MSCLGSVWTILLMQSKQWEPRREIKWFESSRWNLLTWLFIFKSITEDRKYEFEDHGMLILLGDLFFFFLLKLKNQRSRRHTVSKSVRDHKKNKLNLCIMSEICLFRNMSFNFNIKLILHYSMYGVLHELGMCCCCMYVWVWLVLRSEVLIKNCQQVKPLSSSTFLLLIPLSLHLHQHHSLFCFSL